MPEATLNKNMIEGQIKPINGMSEELLSAFYLFDRNDFMPETMKEMSYVEKNIIFESFFNIDGDLSKLVKYFDKYSLFLQKNSFNLFVNGVINHEI